MLHKQLENKLDTREETILFKGVRMRKRAAQRLQEEILAKLDGERDQVKIQDLNAELAELKALLDEPAGETKSLGGF